MLFPQIQCFGVKSIEDERHVHGADRAGFDCGLTCARKRWRVLHACWLGEGWRVVVGDQGRTLLRYLKHLADGGNARNRLFAEGSDAVADGPEQLAVNVNRAAAHTRNNAGVFGLGALKPGKDHVLTGAESVMEKA